ncbi:MAG: CPBP family intramembrane metalloprotease [Lactobacillus crispatus]|nr:CPBP family intramembrane metalloprotease [Lactobacillus crispatus]
MNTPRSREGNVIRYAVYLAGYVAVFAVVKLVTRKSPVHIWDLILFGLVAAMILLFYVYRFNREQRFFARDYKLPWLGSLSTVVLLTLVITVTQISISYLQSYGRISHYDFQLIYAKSESVNMFWFLIVVQGIVLPILQEFLATGFLFNYAFRRNTKQVAIVSGLIYSLLNFQNSVVLFIIDAIYGMVFAWSYMYTQTLLMPIYLAVVSGVLTVIMI